MRSFRGENFSIGYETWGNPTMRPALFFHGFPGSHLQGGAMAPMLDKHGVFLIAADRPGYGGTIGGGSPGRYLKDLAALLNHLTVREFNVIGVSSGAPWAHLMTSQFHHRVRGLVVACGLGTCNSETLPYFSRFQRSGLRLRGWLPGWASEAVVEYSLRGMKPEQVLRMLVKVLNEPDQRALRDEERRRMLLESMVQARAQGARGIVNDAALYRRDWLSLDCDLERLRAIPTSYFHGKRDKVVDFRFSEWMSARHGNSVLNFFDEEGHYSLAFGRTDEILGSLTK